MSIEKLKQVSEELNAAKAKVQEFAKNEGRAAIGAAFQKCFEAPSKLTEIRWTQYTPYFNDGEECVFSAHPPNLIVDGYEGDGYYEDDGFDTYGIVRSGRYRDEYVKERKTKIVAGLGSDAALEAFTQTWAMLDEEMLKAVFGDHVQITITRDEVTVEDYSHD